MRTLLILLAAGQAFGAELRSENALPNVPPSVMAPSLLPTAAQLPPLPSQPLLGWSAPPATTGPSVVSAHLAQPSHLAAVSPDPRAADAPRPAGASAGLTQVAASLEKENAAPAPEASPSPASRSFFDGAAGKAVKTTVVVAAAATPGGVGMPAAYALTHYAGERRDSPRPQPAPWTHRLAERAEGHLAFVGMGFLGLLARGLLGVSNPALALVAAALAFAGAAGMEELIAHAREQVVGGWQASHDQKYRVDPATGKIKDIRGKKYGEDRYDATEPGPVTPGERLWARLLGAGLGLLLLPSLTGPAALIYSGLLTAAFLAADWRAARRPARELVQTDEDRAHAARFRN